MDISAYLGETLALITAVTWAVAVILFKKSGEGVHPVGLNLFKNLMAVILLVPTIGLFGQTLFRPVPLNEYGLLLISGALGIGIADTLFFMSLNALGASLISIVSCLYSPFIITLSIIFLSENLSIWQLIGATTIVSAVLLALGERRPGEHDRRALLKGISYGVLAQAANACAIVMIKPLLTRSPLFWATEVRLVGGVIVLLIILLLSPARRTIVRSIRSSRHWVYTITGSFTGAYLAMMLWLAGMKYTQASTAAALNQTSAIFIFLFAAIFLKEKVTRLRVIGIALGVIGAFLVTFG